MRDVEFTVLQLDDATGSIILLRDRGRRTGGSGSGGGRSQIRTVYLPNANARISYPEKHWGWDVYRTNPKGKDHHLAHLRNAQ